MMTKKMWSKPQLESLNVHMTEATDYSDPNHDEAFNGNSTKRLPNGDLVPHHGS